MTIALAYLSPQLKCCIVRSKVGSTTFSIKTFSMMVNNATLSIPTLSIKTFSIMV
jgi:hypothetical protein